MSTKLKTLLPLAFGAALLAGCEGYEKTGTGAAIGAAVGAIGGEILGNTNKGRNQAIIVGAAVGAGIGAALDKQARELEQSIGGSGALIQNTGEQIIVTLPEAITFDTDSAAVRPSLQGTLAELARSLQQYPDTVAQVVGHTDNVGDPAYNQGLSERRGNSVATVLVNNGVPFSRVQTSGMGLRSPIASNATASGRAQNRRVEVVIVPTGA